MEVTNADPDNRHAVVQSMVTTEDARWLAGYLRKMVSTRPAAWAGTEMTLSQLIALHFISAKAPMTLIALSEALCGVRGDHASGAEGSDGSEPVVSQHPQLLRDHPD